MVVCLSNTQEALGFLLSTTMKEGEEREGKKGGRQEGRREGQ